ncbi:MAG: tetratricopeptide repeat protein [Polyangiales bacterium]
MTETRTKEESQNRALCEAHGLAYDPTIHSGCVVCRRNEISFPPAVTPPPSKKLVALLMSLGVLALVMSIGAMYAYFDRRRALIDADEPTEPEVGQVVASLPGMPEHKGTIMLGRSGTDAYGYPNDLPDKLTLLSLLREKRFEELSSHLESFQKAFEEDFRQEKWPMVAFEAFNIADKEVGGLIDEWVRAMPDSFAPYQARAKHQIALAWHYRGAKWADLTAKKRFAKMGKILVHVPADLDRALELRPALMEAYCARLTLASAFGSSMGDRTAILESALRHCPYCFGIRAAYLGSIVPRWGGSYALMASKAADWQYTEKNPKLRQLLGFADDDRCDLLRKKQPAKAIEFCDRAIAEGANAGFLLTKGAALIHLKRYDEAVDVLSDALEILPQSVSSLNARGLAFLELERYEEAARDLVLATRLDPLHKQAETNLHHILAKLVRLAYEKAEAGKLDEAIAEYTRVLDVHPRYAHAYLYRAQAYNDKREPKLAEQDYLRSIEIDPSNIESYRGLDHVLAQQKRFDEIILHWNRYLERKPKDARALYERSGTYYHKGQMDLAKRDVSAACRLGHEEACKTEKRFYPE